MKFYVIFLIPLIVLSACSLNTMPVDDNTDNATSNNNCPSGLYADGLCCVYVCELYCEEYKPNTCNCECMEDIGLSNFDDNPSIQPPAFS